MNLLLKALCIVSALLALITASRVQAHVYNQYRPVHNPPRFQLVPPARPLRPSSFPRLPTHPAFNLNQQGRLNPQTLTQQQQPFQPFPPVSANPLQPEFVPPALFREAFNPEVNPFEPLLPPIRDASAKLRQNSASTTEEPVFSFPFLQSFGSHNKLPHMPIGAVPSENNVRTPIPTTTKTPSTKMNLENNQTTTTRATNSENGRQMMFPHTQAELPSSSVPTGVDVTPKFERPVVITPPILEPLGSTDELFSSPSTVMMPLTSTMSGSTISETTQPADIISAPMEMNKTEFPIADGQEIGKHSNSTELPSFPLPTGVDVTPKFEHPVVITPPVLEPLEDTDELFSVLIPLTSTTSIPTISITQPANSISTPMQMNKTEFPIAEVQETGTHSNSTQLNRFLTLSNETMDDTASSNSGNLALNPTANNSCNDSHTSIDSTDAETIEFPDIFDISSMENISTNFSCKGLSYGYYADVETDCRIFHHCIPFSDHVIRASFLCPTDTVFNQIHRVCTTPSLSIPCDDSSKFYSVNDELEMLTEELEPSFRMTDPFSLHQSFICSGRSPGNYPDPMATTCNSFVRCSEVLIDGEPILLGERVLCVEGQVFHGALGQCISVPTDFICVF